MLYGAKPCVLHKNKIDSGESLIRLIFIEIFLFLRSEPTYDWTTAESSSELQERPQQKDLSKLIKHRFTNAFSEKIRLSEIEWNQLEYLNLYSCKL